MKIQKIAFCTMVLVCGFFWIASAEEKTILLGGKSGWSLLGFSQRIEKTNKGHLGFESLKVSSQKEAQSQGKNRVELDLSFDALPFVDACGNYTIQSSALLKADSNKAQRGLGAALCNTDNAGLLLRGKNGTVFSTEGDPGSFVISFWMYPTVTENGSVLFQWRSSRIDRFASNYQYIRATLFKNHLEWTFSNIWNIGFAGKEGGSSEVMIAGKKNLIPGQWSFHQIAWDASSGLLEYRVNGSTESVQYITSTGTARGEVYAILLGSPADIEIASRFSGLLDDFRIYRGLLEDVSIENQHSLLEKYPRDGGVFITEALDTGRFNASLKVVKAVQSLPKGTDIQFFVRGGDQKYEWTEDYPAWVPCEPSQKIDAVTGRFFQVKAFLYPDGSGSNTPLLTSLELIYEEDSSPSPPVRIFAQARNKSVLVEWLPSIDYDVKGYLVYYGTYPGEYLGKGSPIDVGNVTAFEIDNLANGTTYYFSVAAYDQAGHEYPGELSKETSARPKLR